MDFGVGPGLGHFHMLYMNGLGEAVYELKDVGMWWNHKHKKEGFWKNGREALFFLGKWRRDRDSNPG